MTEDFLSRLTVLLIQSKEDKRKHDHDHEHCSRRQCHIRFCNKENRHTDCRCQSEADNLPLSQIEHDLGFYAVKILRDRYKCHL